MKLRFLGTGTSFGVPVIGCTCAACTSTDPRDRRSRHGAVIRLDSGANILIDTPTDLRSQLLQAQIDRIDAVWFTHEHADHTHGIDDLRIFCSRADQRLPVYAAAKCAEFMRRKFDYIFDEHYMPAGGPKVNVRLEVFDSWQSVRVAEQDMLALPLPHGDTIVHGFRIGSLGYVTDAKELGPRVIEALAGVRTLVINALWFGRPHPTHFNVEEAVIAAETVNADRTFLTHLTHRVTHQELLDRLPPRVQPAYDGLEIEL